MKKGLSRLLLVMIAISMIVSTIPAYEPHAEQGVPPAETTVESTPEKIKVVDEPSENEKPQDTQVTTEEDMQTSSVKEDGDWKDPYYDNAKRLRSVALEKPEKATIKTISNGVGTGTGAMNLSWKAMPGATGYKVIIGNGYNYEYFSVGNVTSWTTKGKGIFPTKAELDKGLYRFHTDGKGAEFANDPTQLYENTFKAGTTWTLRGQKKYIVRVLATYSSGDGPTSDITEAVMPPETLPAKPEKSTIKTVSSGAGTGTGHMDISWQAVPGAIGYKVVIGNGYNYEYFNTGNTTSWTTKGKGIFPSQAEIANKQYKFHQDGKGVEFASDPRALYENGYQAGSTFGLRNQKKYIVRILAVYPWGDGPTSDITDAIMPMEQMAKPTVTSHRSENDENTGYLNVSWQPVTDAISYKIGLFNGYNYDYIDVGKTTNWSTKGKKLWATHEDLATGKYQLHVDGSGSELAMDPSATYQVAFDTKKGTDYSDRFVYYTRVIAVLADSQTPVSEATTLTMPYQDIDIFGIDGYKFDNQTGYVNLEWEPIERAVGYKVWVFNGHNYRAINHFDQTEWSSLTRGIWPTDEKIASGSTDIDREVFGEDLSMTPSKLYALKGTAYANADKFWFRVTAYSEEGQTIAISQVPSVSVDEFEQYVPAEFTEDDLVSFTEEELDSILTTTTEEVERLQEESYDTSDLPEIDSDLIEARILPFVIPAVAAIVIRIGSRVVVKQTLKNGVKRNITVKNGKLAGKSHPKTGVKFDAKGFPKFSYKAQMTLPNSLLKSSNTKQFKEANAYLKKYINKGEISKSKFTANQLKDIQNGYTPRGMTWHHHQDRGKMQLVDKAIHQQTGHTGGKAIWGTN
ncbi:HNH endonuclease [Listeria booriae]|uniref:HNH endonuclease n=1 Tax=Listeria booriae TaxID=1552123 RepID=UPI001627984B|nr:HNH endonuclease [Listeria booriae]MBC2048393.1 HNH endonuclease [Listeria booriae]